VDRSTFIFKIGQPVTMQYPSDELNCDPRRHELFAQQLRSHTLQYRNAYCCPTQRCRRRTAPNKKRIPFSLQMSTMHSLVRYFTAVSVNSIKLYSV
jgi:hypothetical protein